MISQTPLKREPINLQGGWPTPALHPVTAMKEAAAKVFAGKDIEKLLQYGPEHGNASLRKHLGAWLEDAYQPQTGPIGPERIIVTNGASNGLATILQKFTDPGVTRAIWMVEPTYFLACPVFRDAGFSGQIRGVPEGTDSIDLDYLKAALAEVDGRDEDVSASSKKSAKNGYPKIYRHVLYMIPTFSNPSGKTMRLEDRQALVQIARQHDMLIVTDDVYDLLHWKNEAAQGTGEAGKTPLPPRLVDVDRAMEGYSAFGNAVSNGSFSKIVAPGTRVGWLEASPNFVAAMGTVGATVSGGCQGHLASLIINQMLVDGAINRHLEEVLIPTYRRRYGIMVDAIHRYLRPYGVEIMTDDQSVVQTNREDGNQSSSLAGGFFLYITFPDDGTLPNASEIARVALEDYELRIAPGHLFTVTDDLATANKRSNSYLHGARLCWAWHEEEGLLEGIERLAEVLERLKRTN